MNSASQYLKYLSEPTFLYIADACKDDPKLIERVSQTLMQISFITEGSFMELADEALSRYGL